MNNEKLIEEAKSARLKAYTPYSNFKVGAALLAKDGKVFHGCNVENASYGLTNCAERVAIGSMVVAGAQRFVTVAVIAEPPAGAPVAPCGACRQVLAEFGPHARVLLAAPDPASLVVLTSMDELLPGAFSFGTG